jgi:hypothetical protein
MKRKQVSIRKMNSFRALVKLALALDPKGNRNLSAE